MCDNRRIAINTVILYVKLIVTSVVGLVTSRLVLQALGEADFGLYNVVGGIVVMMNVFNTAMITTTYRYIAFEVGRKEEGNPNQVFNISSILHLLFAVLILLLGETIGRYYVGNYLNILPGQADNAMFVLHCSILTAMINTVSVPFMGLLTAMEDFRRYAIIEILFSFLKLIAVFYLLHYVGDQLRFYAVLMTVLTLVTTVSFVFVGYSKYKDVVKLKFYRNGRKVKEMFYFTNWILVGALATIGKTQGAAILINYFFGTILNAAYGVANQLNSFVLMFTQNLSSAAIPQITKSFSGGDSGRSVQLVAYISKYSFFLMLFPALPFILQTEFILNLWLKEVPSYAAIFSRLMIIDALIGCLGAGIPALIQATGKIKYFQLINSGLSLISLPIAFICFKLGAPPYSILMLYCILSFIFRINTLYLLYRLLQFDVKEFCVKSYLPILRVVIFISPLFILNVWLDDSLVNNVVIIVLAELVLCGGICLVGLQQQERSVLKNKIAILIKKK